MNPSNRANCSAELSPTALLLAHRASAREQGPLIVQQASLALSDDQQRIVLRRYFEHYSPEGGEWVEYVHSVETRDLIHWMMAQGQLQVDCPAAGNAQ
ncbi:MAG: hypothetical protein LBE53_13930 [Paucimonas sp.]|jgi:hypothetical protein|uniref:hypothetical protein n=1 Tax=Pantoea sp. Cy-639 TaxID=2608360 RepID=UPI001422A0EC|nr:hypothetical protein [Pantoea sp. Cy-639]MDR2308276.1 hypothetical protein [Paucimonas sp.]NIF19696.1 hypothetical protein [Pantoea sp. Cy-639]